MTADALVVVHEIPAAVEDRAIAIDLYRLEVVGGMAVDDVDPALAAPWITEAQRERRGPEAQLGQQVLREQLSSNRTAA